jgi:hypothetical protein
MKQGHLEGRSTAHAGEVVFSDIAKGMNRVSFLHTHIYHERPLVWFFNVQWLTGKADQYLFDAKLVYNQERDWPQLTPPHREKQLLRLFSLPDNPQEGELVRLVRLDVERTSREIRRYYEDFGNYPDAGNYYIAEMDYRRVRTPWWPKNPAELLNEPRRLARVWRRFRDVLSSAVHRLALELYRFFSVYGEAPGRALFCLVGVQVAFAVAYMFTGFKVTLNDGSPWTVCYRLASDPANTARFLQDIPRAILFALVNLVPGYFRGQSQAMAPTSEWTSCLATIEAVFGVTLITLFLLALRRRFRR